MKGISKPVYWAGVIGLFFASFLFFLYFTFPYGVLKEAITASINKQSNYNVQIGKLGPKFPLGVTAENILVFTDKGKKDLKIHSASISLSVLRLFIGQLYTDITVDSKNGGELDLGMSFGLLSLFQAGAIPDISLEADRFAIDGFLDFGLSSLSTNRGVSPLLQPLLNQIRLTGMLNGEADISLDLADPKSSSGNMDLKMKGGKLMIDDPGLNIVPQNFSKFAIKAKMDKGALVIDKISGLTTQEMKIDLNGKISFNRVITASPVAVNLGVELKDGLKDNFGLIVELAMGGKDGRGNIQVAGTLGNPFVNKM